MNNAPRATLRTAAAGGLLALLSIAGHCAEPQAHPHWSYSGQTGPNKWSEIDSKFTSCSQGKVQSPIDIHTADAKHAALSELKFDYQASPLKVIDNGHTIQVNYAPGSFLTVDGKRYELLQFHFHKPSEERIDGKRYALVAHLVHKNAEGELAVVGVLMEPGAKRPMIKTIFDNLPLQKEKEVEVPGVSINIATLLPENHAHYTFSGSLTTPPCSEGVKWFVMKTPVPVSSQQIAQFGHVYKMNARPVQASNGRVVEIND
ncbi:carbonic anhydrase [Duganella sp. CF517]|uniref:carbonic anhydrase n=1 Tax=Duganella sp. CF517 TaxID=1881038 RepID=UPI0008BEE181|nr:carbonic anhydrase family protein [Duganella sp. CF517]SEN98670.1 carbonic anhydrase [Duganella sp. CF517]